MSKTTRNNRITSEDFVVAWATSNTLDEFLKTTGMKKSAANARASTLRKLGVKLPKLTQPKVHSELRIAQLNSLINKHDIRKQR